jgi:hypothetical protein
MENPLPSDISSKVSLHLRPNLAQICRWWVASTNISESLDSNPFQQIFSRGVSTPSTSSVHMDSFPSNLAPLAKPITELDFNIDLMSHPSMSLNTVHSSQTVGQPVTIKKSIPQKSGHTYRRGSQNYSSSIQSLIIIMNLLRRCQHKGRSNPSSSG